MNGRANVKLWDAVGNRVVRTFPRRQQDQLHKCKICCALDTVLDADYGPGARDCRGRVWKRRDWEGLKKWTMTFPAGRWDVNSLWPQ